MARRFTMTWDNPSGGDYRRVTSRLSRLGTLYRRAPRTTAVLEPHPDVTFADIKRAFTATLDSRRGSAVLVSSKTGRVYELNNRGNRPGRFVRV
jgi:hypothetical protein